MNTYTVTVPGFAAVDTYSISVLIVGLLAAAMVEWRLINFLRFMAICLACNYLANEYRYGIQGWVACGVIALALSIGLARLSRGVSLWHLFAIVTMSAILTALAAFSPVTTYV